MTLWNLCDLLNAFKSNNPELSDKEVIIGDDGISINGVDVIVNEKPTTNILSVAGRVKLAAKKISAMTPNELHETFYGYTEEELAEYKKNQFQIDLDILINYLVLNNEVRLECVEDYNPIQSRYKLFSGVWDSVATELDESDDDICETYRSSYTYGDVTVQQTMVYDQGYITLYRLV